MTIRVTPKEFANKWKVRLDAAIPDMEAGINRVTEAPGVKAAASADKFLAKIRESVETGRWQAGVASVSLSDWKEAMIKKGLVRIRQGTESALGKQEKFAAALFPAIESAQSRLSNMPSVTLDDNIARATEFMRGMATFHYKGA